MEELRNLNTAYKTTRLTVIIIIILSFIFSTGIYFLSRNDINKSREKIYVLTNGDILQFALSKNMEENRPAEIKNHLLKFHKLFFEFDPDPNNLKNEIDQALVLIDNSGQQMHSNRKEALYYHKIIEGSISSRVKIDSMKVDVSSYPFKSIVYAKQKLIRPSNMILKNLVATCQLRNVKRTDDNPHGLFIENYKLINNKTIDEKSRN